MLMESLLSVNWDVDQVSTKGQSRVSIDTWLSLPLEHTNQSILYVFQLARNMHLAIDPSPKWRPKT